MGKLEKKSVRASRRVAGKSPLPFGPCNCDPPKQKRRPNAFNLFFKHVCERKKNQEVKQPGYVIMLEAAECWRKLTPAQKKDFISKKTGGQPSSGSSEQRSSGCGGQPSSGSSGQSSSGCGWQPSSGSSGQSSSGSSGQSSSGSSGQAGCGDPMTPKLPFHCPRCGVSIP